MPARIEVDPESMESSLERLRTIAGDLQSELDHLTHHLDVLSSQWSGAAHDAYREAQINWNESMGVSKETLDAAANMLAQAIDAYKQAESSVIRACG